MLGLSVDAGGSCVLSLEIGRAARAVGFGGRLGTWTLFG